MTSCPSPQLATRTRARAPRHLATVALLGTALMVGAACSGGSGKTATSTAPASTTPASRSAAATPKAVNPLTGGAVSRNGVVAAKIDDTANGRPQRNIDKADVVYIEEVEGGLTRLLAVFNNSLPSVEAVRSTRAADPEILAQYGAIGYVTSGGAPNPLSILDKSPLKTAIGDRGSNGITRDPDRPVPYNEVGDLAKIAKLVKAPRAKYVGFQWSQATSWLAKAPKADHVRTTVGGTAVDFRYNAKTHRYIRYIDGTMQKTAAGVPVSTTNVLVQFCDVKPYYKDRDVNGNPNAFTYTVGKGTIALFRDGRRVNGTWVRGKSASPTVFRTLGGKQILLHPGNVWVVLSKKGNKIS